MSEEILEELRELRREVGKNTLAIERVAFSAKEEHMKLDSRVRTIEILETDRKDLKKQIRGYILAAVIAAALSAFALVQGCQAWLHALTERGVK